jgi:Domain of unknown function DUF29
MSDTYEGDILIWSEHQAKLLRRIAAGELVNSADLDWPNIAEEIESVGRSEFRACEGLLRQRRRRGRYPKPRPAGEPRRHVSGRRPRMRSPHQCGSALMSRSSIGRQSGKCRRR